MAKAFEQFMKDLMADKDYQEHKKNAIVYNYNHESEPTMADTFRVASVKNDTSNLFIHLNFLDYETCSFIRG